MILTDLPQFAPLAGRRDVKVVRHKDTRLDLPHLYRHGGFEEYQTGQGREVFAKANLLISFLAERDKYPRFVGVWEVNGVSPKGKGVRYDLTKMDGYGDLENRLVVSWGDATRAWIQWLHSKGNKTVNELLPPGFVKDFPGFYDFTLTYSELQEIFRHRDANREWVRMLRAVAGVYAIQDSKTGKLYVGSAYGVNGIWGRWSAYARNAHGNNKQLIALLEKQPDASERFIFSILRAMEPNAQKDEVIAHEGMIKEKLGSRVHGLNSN